MSVRVDEIFGAVRLFAALCLLHLGAALLRLSLLLLLRSPLLGPPGVPALPLVVQLTALLAPQNTSPPAVGEAVARELRGDAGDEAWDGGKRMVALSSGEIAVHR